MDIPELLLNKVSKPVAVFGLGVTGHAVIRFLQKIRLDYVVYDSSGLDNAKTTFSDPDAPLHDLVIYSQGFPPNHPWLHSANRVGVLCLGELDFASLFCKAPIIAVTGTNGKTSTTEFLAHALRHLGKNAAACGNAGTPLVDCSHLFQDPNAFLVCETSSFQAETLAYLVPHSVLWTNFYEDHLDRHPSLDAYFLAKWNLIHQLQANPLYIGSSVAQMAQKLVLELPQCTQVVLPSPGPGIFAQGPQQANFALVQSFWLSQGWSPHILHEAAQSFPGVPHRMQFVAEFDGISFWNDSKATNFSAVLPALDTFSEPIHWIGGGKSKGGNIEAFATALTPLVHKAYLIGETSEQLSSFLDVPYQIFSTLETATQTAFEEAKAHKQRGHVVLSPGFASFDMFSNYAQRGNSFQAAVLLLKKHASPV